MKLVREFRLVEVSREGERERERERARERERERDLGFRARGIRRDRI